MSTPHYAQLLQDAMDKNRNYALLIGVGLSSEESLRIAFGDDVAAETQKTLERIKQIEIAKGIEIANAVNAIQGLRDLNEGWETL